MSIGATSGTAFSAGAAGTSSVLPDDKRQNGTDAVAAFRNEAKKSPIDRIRESVLKRHKLTQEQLNNLPPEQQSAIQQEIAEAIKRAMKATTSGTNANVVV